MAEITDTARPRWAESLVRETLADTPVSIVQGARQVGKSTMVRRLVRERGGRLLSLDSADILTAAEQDPDGFVRQFPVGLLAIDEAQRVPALIRALKAAVDEDRRPGRFLITGSADLLEVPGAGESLAGRAETIPLYGFSQGELMGVRDDLVTAIVADQLQGLHSRTHVAGREEYARVIVAGGFPEAQLRHTRRRERWFDNYLARVIEHDAAEVSRLRQLERLDKLLRLIASSNAGELVKAKIARQSGIPETSVDPYVRLLETLYLVHRLPAWGNSLPQRVVGRPKIIVIDSGVAAHLAGQTAERLTTFAADDQFGPLFEAFVASELLKQQTWSKTPFRLHHYRDREGHEVDLIAELADGRVIAFEIKAARSTVPGHLRGLAFLRDKLKDRFAAGVVLNTSLQPLRLGDRLWSAPASCLWATFP